MDTNNTRSAAESHRMDAKGSVHLDISMAVEKKVKMESGDLTIEDVNEYSDNRILKEDVKNNLKSLSVNNDLPGYPSDWKNKAQN